MKRHRGGPQGNKTTMTLKKNLTWGQASKAATKKVGGDWRGMKYDPKTGKATVV